jgi:hypothetical protein
MSFATDLVVRGFATAAVLVDADGTPITGATDLVVGSQVAAAANNQTLAGAAGKTTHIAGFHVDGLGATGASGITVTVTGLGVTLSYTVAIPAGATVALGAGRLVVAFARPIPASAPNTAIVVNVPSFGAGNTVAQAGAYGFQL